MPETQITFSSLVPQDVTVSVSEEDINLFKGVQRDAVLFYIEFQDFTHPILYSSFQKDFVSLCEKFGVNSQSKKDRLSFAKALMSLT